MTTDLIREVCRRELLFDIEFLNEYKKELDALIADNAFMDVIDRISGSVPESLEFSCDPSNPDFKHFKKETISNAFFNENLKYRFPAYQSIVGHSTKFA